MYDYYIIADYVTYNDCLVCLAGHSQEQAERAKQKVLTGIQNGDERYAKIVGNVRIKKAKSEDCWWNQGGLD